MHKFQQVKSYVGEYLDEERDFCYMTILGDFRCRKCNLLLKGVPDNEEPLTDISCKE